MWTYFQEDDNPGRGQTVLEAHCLGLDTVGARVCFSHNVGDSCSHPFSLARSTKNQLGTFKSYMWRVFSSFLK